MLLVESGESVFEVLDLVGERNAMVQTVEDSPGRYPFLAQIERLAAAPDLE
ncbi:hypothetical protein [Nocardia sp. NPDC004722]